MRGRSWPRGFEEGDLACLTKLGTGLAENARQLRELYSREPESLVGADATTSPGGLQHLWRAAPRFVRTEGFLRRGCGAVQEPNHCELTATPRSFSASGGSRPKPLGAGHSAPEGDVCVRALHARQGLEDGPRRGSAGKGALRRRIQSAAGRRPHDLRKRKWGGVPSAALVGGGWIFGRSYRVCMP